MLMGKALKPNTWRCEVLSYQSDGAAICKLFKHAALKLYVTYPPQLRCLDRSAKKARFYFNSLAGYLVLIRPTFNPNPYREWESKDNDQAKAAESKKKQKKKGAAIGARVGLAFKNDALTHFLTLLKTTSNT